MELRYRYRGAIYRIQIEAAADGSLIARIGDRTHRVEVEHQRGGHLIMRIDGQRVRAFSAAWHSAHREQHRHVALMNGGAQVYELERAPVESARGRSASGGTDSLEAPMPGQVRQVEVIEGDAVSAGQTLLILEAMKMEIRISAPHAGIVSRLLAQVGQTVERGQMLAEVTPAEG